jgi:hypothetical protein
MTRSDLWPVASSLHASRTRTSAGVMSALHTTRLSCEAKCVCCRSRAACTRALTTDDGSPTRSPVSFSYGTRGTST